MPQQGQIAVVDASKKGALIAKWLVEGSDNLSPWLWMKTIIGFSSEAGTLPRWWCSTRHRPHSESGRRHEHR